MTNAKTRLVKILMYLVGALAAVVFVTSKNRNAMLWVTSQDYQYGDLYRLSKVHRFKPDSPLPTGSLANKDSIDVATSSAPTKNLLFFGDSFGFCDWGRGPLHRQLSEKMGQTFFSVYNNNHNAIWRDPYSLLASDAGNSQPRVMVFQIAERLITSRFLAPDSVGASPAPVPPAGKLKQFRAAMFEGTEAKHEMILKHCAVTSPLVELWNSAMYEGFGKLPKETPVCSVRPSMLFFRDEVECFRMTHGDDMIATLVANISRFDQELWERFHCRLVFLPIPNKFTVYSRWVDERPYDQFLPRLCEALREKGVNIVDLLPRFREEKQLLYWPTDTHWNNEGIKLATEEALRVIQKLKMVTSD